MESVRGGVMTDKDMVRLMKEECICRAAAYTGSERRFYQALANILEDILVQEGREFVRRLADAFEISDKEK
jgi:hypothetical protein